MELRLLHESSEDDINELGAKACNLAMLYSLDLPIPRGFVIPASVCDDFLNSAFDATGVGEITSPWTTNGMPLYDDADNLYCTLLQAPVKREIQDQLINFYVRLGLHEVSVRSSATLEDSNSASFAGIFDTYLSIDKKGLVNAVKKCWCSLYSQRSLRYLLRNGPSPGRLRMAVIIQEMIKPTCSGVCFTINPITHNENEFYIEAVWGLGEAVVGGRITPDTYVYDIAGGVIKEKRISPQKMKRVSIGNQTLDVQVERENVSGQKLSDTSINKLIESCVRIRDNFGIQQDIEFAIADDVIYFLQSRPISV